MFQARAIADIVRKLEWSYVSLVSSEGLYGDSGSKEFAKQAQKRNICIAIHEKISPTIDQNAYDQIVSNLEQHNATGVVLFTRAEDTRELLLAVKRANLTRNFAWVAADGWGTHQNLVADVEEVAWGAITVELQAKAIPGFDQWMTNLTPWTNTRNPWFSEYWEEWFNCKLDTNLIQQQQVASGQAYAASSAAKRRDSSVALSAGWSTERDQDSTETRPYDEADVARRRRREASSKAQNLDDTNVSNCSISAPYSCSIRQVGGSIMLRDQSVKQGPSQIGSTRELHHTPQQAVRRLVSRSWDNNDKIMKPPCSANLRISEKNGYKQEQKVQFVVDAVYAMAHALNKAWKELCGGRGKVCESLKELNGKLV